MRKVVFLIALLSIWGHKYSHAQEVAIPDAHFLQALIHAGVDGNHDGKIQTSEVLSVKRLNIAQAEISDLTGIGAFTNLDSLNCSINKLTTLDVSKNTGLVFLSCSNNKLVSLVVTGTTALKTLDCGFNKLTSLDVSSVPNLEILECYVNLLDTLDVSKNTHLTGLYCGNNSIRNLDLSANIHLTLVDCSYNVLSNVNLKGNAQLTSLSCYSNRLTSLDVTNNKLLTRMDIGKNLYPSLDLSKNDSLKSLDCSQDPNLLYVCVKDTAKVSSNFYFLKDDHTKWTSNCTITDGIPENDLLYSVEISPNPGTETFYLALRQKAHVHIFSTTGAEVARFANVRQLQFGQDFPPGMYLVYIIFPGNTISRSLKIVKVPSR